jgi:hypothetical protein
MSSGWPGSPWSGALRSDRAAGLRAAVTADGRCLIGVELAGAVLAT